MVKGMNKKQLEYICIILVAIIIIGIVGGLLYNNRIKDQQNKAANRLSYSAYQSIDTVINMTLYYHINNNVSSERKTYINYLMNSSINNLRYSKKLYKKAGYDHSNLNNSISALLKLRNYVNVYWGNKEKIIPVLENITLLTPPDNPDMSTISYYHTSFDGEYVDYSQEIEEALENGDQP